MTLVFKCGHCEHEGVRAGNGYSTWCHNCGMNNKLTLVEEKQMTSRIVNGIWHLDNMEVVTYDDLHIVTESPYPGTVRVTIYKGTNPVPLSKETYGHVSSNLDK